MSESLEHVNKRPKMLSSLGPKWIPNILSRISSSVVLSAPLPTLNTNNLLIGTHDGSFHCDEALAISLLKILPQYEHATIVRTRDPETLSKCNIVVDVGAKYEPENHLYDHHQREFTGVLEGYPTKLSSAGLVYKHFGKEIIKEICNMNNNLHTVESTTTTTTTTNTTDKLVIDDNLIHILYHKLYKDFIEHIDAIDNGITIADSPLKYDISTTLSNRVGTLNPAWNELQSKEIYNDRFKLAMSLTCNEFLSTIHSLINIWWPARSIVVNSIQHRHIVHNSGKIVTLSQFCPWKDHLFDIEKELNMEGDILYMLYQDTGGSWRIQAVPENPTSFHSRKKLPSPICGLRDDTLSEKTGIPGCIFIHASGFIGGHKTYDGALALAIQALEFTE